VALYHGRKKELRVENGELRIKNIAFKFSTLHFQLSTLFFHRFVIATFFGSNNKTMMNELRICKRDTILNSQLSIVNYPLSIDLIEGNHD